MRITTVHKIETSDSRHRPPQRPPRGASGRVSCGADGHNWHRRLWRPVRAGRPPFVVPGSSRRNNEHALCPRIDLIRPLSATRMTPPRSAHDNSPLCFGSMWHVPALFFTPCPIKYTSTTPFPEYSKKQPVTPASLGFHCIDSVDKSESFQCVTLK